MGQMILGLDIGQSSIKGVRLSKGFRGLQLVDLFVHELPEDGSVSEPGCLDQRQIEGLEILIEEGKIVTADLIALSLPGDLISSRNLSFPFSDPKKLAQIVPFEIEAELPFDLDELTVDYMVLKHHNQPTAIETGKETPLLVAAIQNSILSRYLEQLQALGIDPAWIGPSALAHFGYAQYFLGVGSKSRQDQDTLLLINFGASKTVLCHIYGRGIQWIRTIPIGGELLTNEIKRECKLSWEEAETRKYEVDLLKNDPNSADKAALTALENGINRWMTEIEKTVRINHSPLHSKQSDEPQARRQLHLCGGGSEMNGLETLLSDRLEMEAVAITDSGSGPASSISGMDLIEEDLITSVYSEAAGVAFQESDGPPINFRKGLFVFRKEHIQRRHQLVTIGVIGLILLALAGGDLYLRYSMKEQHYQTLKETLRDRFTETFPKIRNVVNEVEQTRVAITQLNKRSDFFGANEKSPLLVLKEVTDAIPSGVKIDIFNIVIDKGKVRIQAHTSSFESVDRIRSGLLKKNQFKGVEISDAKVMADQKRVRFRIKMDIVSDQSS